MNLLSLEEAKKTDFSFAFCSLIRNFAADLEKSVNMEARTKNYTAQDWAEHEQFVQMFRAAKQRKRAWQQKMEVVLAEKAEKIRKRREEIDKLFEK